MLLIYIKIIWKLEISLLFCCNLGVAEYYSKTCQNSERGATYLCKVDKCRIRVCTNVQIKGFVLIGADILCVKCKKCIMYKV